MKPEQQFLGSVQSAIRVALSQVDIMDVQVRGSAFTEGRTLVIREFERRKIGKS